LLRIMQSELP